VADSTDSGKKRRVRHHRRTTHGKPSQIFAGRQRVL
jgi:hypothetical protein